MKNGDIITLENGDIMEVQLKKIGHKPGKLEVNKVYRLKHTGEYCYTAIPFNAISRRMDMDHYFNTGEFIFIGEITISPGQRNIFYNKVDSSYAMFGIGNIDYVVAELN
jgi:hypothetical protein